MTEQTLAGIGHNQPPADPLVVRTKELVGAANQWVAAPIATQDEADKLSAFIDQLRAAEKDVEGRRKKEKQPHLDAAAAVDTEWNPLKDLLAKAKTLVMPRLTAWLQKLEQERQELLRQQREEAERKEREAAEAAAKAAEEAQNSGDVVGAAVAAEAAAKAAEEAQKTVTKLEKTPVNMQSSLGARTKSLRTIRRARVVSHAMALGHYKNHPEIVELVQTLAARDARAGVETIPGVEFFNDQQAA